MRRRLRELLDRLRDRWNGAPGRHAYAFGVISRVAGLQPRIAVWPSEAAWTRQLHRRPVTLRASLCTEAEAYWRDRYQELYIMVALDTAEANKTRRECGLGPRELPPLPPLPSAAGMPAVGLVAA